MGLTTWEGVPPRRPAGRVKYQSRHVLYLEVLGDWSLGTQDTHVVGGSRKISIADHGELDLRKGRYAVWSKVQSGRR